VVDAVALYLTLTHVVPQKVSEHRRKNSGFSAEMLPWRKFTKNNDIIPARPLKTVRTSFSIYKFPTPQEWYAVEQKNTAKTVFPRKAMAPVNFRKVLLPIITTLQRI